MIHFVNNINAGHLRKAFNNDVVEFYTDQPTQNLYCDVTFSGTAVRLYPNVQGRYFFNFRPFIAAIINTRDFEDILQPNINANSPADFIYNFSQGTYFNTNVTFTINLGTAMPDTATYNLSWFAGVEQPGDYNTFLTTDWFLLSPFRRDTANHYFIKYWEGYPFDIPLYSSAQKINLSNQTTGISQDFVMPGVVSRIVLSDGRTDETLESLLPLAEGHNAIRISVNETESADDKFLTLQKVPYSCGIYLKWLNKYGGYSYWLFEDTYSIDRSTKQLGELARDNANLQNSFARTVQIGKESRDTAKIIAELLNDDERRIVEGILDSPKIYLFTGRPFSQNGIHEWIEVMLKTGSARIKNARQPLTNFSFDIELPQRYTQTL